MGSLEQRLELCLSEVPVARGRICQGILSELISSPRGVGNDVMPERPWPLHSRQVELRRMWRSLLLCCCSQHQEENLDLEALIVVPVSEILMIHLPCKE